MADLLSVECPICHRPVGIWCDASGTDPVVRDGGGFVHDERRVFAERVERAKADAVASGRAVQAPPPNPAVIRAQELRSELAGFAGLPAEARANAHVQRAVYPKIDEYVNLRLKIAGAIVLAEICSELGMTQEELHAVAGSLPVARHKIDQQADTAAVADGPYRTPVTQPPSVAERVALLEEQVVMLSKDIGKLERDASALVAHVERKLEQR